MPAKSRTAPALPAQARQASVEIKKDASWTPDDSSVFRTTFGPLLIMTGCPILVRVLMTLIASPNAALFQALLTVDPTVWPSPNIASLKILAGFILLQALLLTILPGDVYYGPVTRRGNQPLYKLNGLSAFFLTHAILILAESFVPGFRLAYLMDMYPSFVMTCEAVGLALCFLIYVKGIYFPSSSDSSIVGNIIFDFWNGSELHPTVYGINVKQLFNCRVSMLGWSVIAVACIRKQYEILGYASNSLVVASALQVIYLAKFFYWESGYFGTLDIIHDRFGFYICWGIMTWVPAIYPISSVYLMNNPVFLNDFVALSIFLVGMASIYLNYTVDAEKQLVRSTKGKCQIWGKPPVLIEGHYVTDDGKQRSNLLLASGWWGVSRHFHYVPELILAYSWSLPAFTLNIIPYVYAIFLTILLFDRAYRDDERCRFKYGESWTQYCKRVPHRIIPGLF